MGHVHCDEGAQHPEPSSLGNATGSPTSYAHLHYADTSYHEAMKQLELLADHVLKPGWDCPQCMTKHALDAEAYAEEATKLTGAEGRHERLAEKARRIYRMVASGDLKPIPEMVRQIRIAGP